MLAAPLALTLWLTPEWLQCFGIPTPDMSLVLRRRTALMQRWADDWPCHPAVALGLIAASLSISGLSPAPTG